MAKVADVKLKWKKSPSSDVAKVEITVTVDGSESTAELGPEIENFMVEVKAGGSCQFQIDTTDSEGLVGTSTTYSFSLGNLEAPLPATELGHEIVAIRDVPDGGDIPVTAAR